VLNKQKASRNNYELTYYARHEAEFETHAHYGCRLPHFVGTRRDFSPRKNVSKRPKYSFDFHKVRDGENNKAFRLNNV